jgi:DNA polymerase-4
MDAFFASVEILDQPELRGKPVVVGGSDRGVVCAASYEARKYGVRSAMPAGEARRRCPHAVFLPVRMHRYKEVSRLAMARMRELSPLVQQTSVDEAYIDISGIRSEKTPVEIALALKEDIKTATGCTCSVGVAPNKFLAKIASDMNKPDGLYIIEEQHVAVFLENLPVGKIPGIGPKSLETLHRLGVQTAGDVLKHPPELWKERFGERGLHLYERAQGIDTSPVKTRSEPKSSGSETTFREDIGDREELKRRLYLQSENVGFDLRRHNRWGRTVTLKLRYSDFSTVTRSVSLKEPTRSTEVIFGEAAALLDALPLPRKVRLIGVSVSNLQKVGPRPSLLQSQEDDERLDNVLDAVREKYGKAAVSRGRAWRKGE